MWACVCLCVTVLAEAERLWGTVIGNTKVPVGGEGQECQKNGGDYKIYQTVSSVAFAGVCLEIHRKLNSATTICLEIFAPDLLCLSCYPPSPLTVKTQITEQHFWKFKFFVWVPTSATKLILFNNFLLLMVHCSVLTQYTV